MEYTRLDWHNRQPYSQQYDDIYYSSHGAISEFEHVFFKNNRLPQRWETCCREKKAGFTIAELGFGTGINFVLTASAWMDFLLSNPDINGDATLTYIAVEKHPLHPEDIRAISQQFPAISTIFEELLLVYPMPCSGTHGRLMCDGRVHLILEFMDADKAFDQTGYHVDAWYMDGFSPARNPELWSQTLCRTMALNSSSGATVATYSSAGIVKRNLQTAGFDVAKVAGHGNKREMITAYLRKRPEQQQSAFSDKPWFSYEKAVLKTRVSSEAVIMGGGIAGLSTALSLQKRGWKVTIVDQNAVAGSGASGNPAGLVLPRLSAGDQVEASFFNNAFSLAVNQLDRLQKILPEKFWHKNGCYQVIEKQRAHKIIQQGEIVGTLLSDQSGQTLPDYLNPAENEVLFLIEQAGVIEPAVFCRVLQTYLLQDAKQPVKWIENTVADLKFRGNNNDWELLDNTGNVIIRTPVLILANGNSASKLSVTSGLPFHSIRGQVCEIEENEAYQNVRKAISADVYMTPLVNGYYHAGASYVLNDDSSELRQSEQDFVIEKLQHVVKGITKPQRLKGRVGFRMASQDRLPVIGAMPDFDWYRRNYKDIKYGRNNQIFEAGQYLPGLFLSLAHGSRGFTTAFLAAEMIASLLCHQVMPVNRNISERVHPSRFVVHQLKRGR